MHRIAPALFMFMILTVAGSAAGAAKPAASSLGVKSWLYWLTNIEPEVVAATNYDLAVIDYSSDGEDENAFAPTDLALMRKKPDGSRRLVVSYMSLGEAEDYRYYWKKDWKHNPPAWLDQENPEWKGNYKVRYWDPDWQRIIFGAPGSYLDRIIAAGFDGVYLDIIDAFEYYGQTRPSAAKDMIRFVAGISEYAKKKRPGFLIFPQNGERLLAYPEYRAVIDGIAKEDLFYGHENDNTPTPEEETAFSAEHLDMALRDGKLVITMDYPTERPKADDAYRKSKARGYIPYVSVRDLDRFVFNAALDPAMDPAAYQAAVKKTGAGRYATTTAPKGTFRYLVAFEYGTEKNKYSAEDFADAPSEDFEAKKFYETAAVFTMTYGITGQWEAGVAIPAVKGHFEKDPGDQVTGLKGSYDQTGLGNVRLLLAHARVWNEGDDSIRGDLEIGLPTDTRDQPLSGAEFSGRIAITREHYWKRLGVLGLAAMNTSADKEFGSSEANLEFQLGASYQLTKRVYAALLIGREGDTNKAELNAEYAVSRNRILEIYAGMDLGGEAKAFFAGAGIYF